MKACFLLIASLFVGVVLLGACDGVPGEVGTLPTLAPTDAVPTVDPTLLPTAAPRNTTAPQPTATPVPTSVASSAGETPALDPSLAAVVNGVAISKATLDAQFLQARTYLVQQAGFDAESEEGQSALLVLQRQVLDWLVDQVLIEQAAEEAHIEVTEAAIEAQLLRIRGNDPDRYAAWLQANGLTEDALREQLRADLTTARVREKVTASLVRSAQQVHSRHILLTDAQSASEALTKLRGGADFEALAKEVSEDGTTRELGGDLGFLPKGIMPPAYDAVAFNLAPGQISEVVQSDFGYHIIQVVEIVDERQIPDSLWPVVQQRAFEDWLEQQRANADLQLNTN